MSAYSFLNVQASLSGPGAVINLGAGSGASEEGITIAYVEEKGDTKVGADGSIMQSLRAGQLARITVRLLKTSPVNNQLSQLFNYQKQSSGRWGQNALRIADPVRGDVVSGSQIAFTKQPDLVYAKDGNTNEWVFQGAVEELLGNGSPIVTGN